jgi:hypothetical protein
MLELDLPSCNAVKSIMEDQPHVAEFYSPDYKLPEDEEKK